uniref:Uncharacterized protein n=1 Tax=Equus asinus asinus TaxID=83772 RepID=A0A8C4MP38_EQUAS
MAEGAAGREGPAPADAAGGEDDPRAGPDAASGDGVAAAPGGRGRDRRSGVALPGAAGPPADSEAGLLEAARATPRRSSIIKNSVFLCHARKQTLSYINKRNVFSKFALTNL